MSNGALYEYHHRYGATELFEILSATMQMSLYFIRKKIAKLIIICIYLNYTSYKRRGTKRIFYLLLLPLTEIKY